MVPLPTKHIERLHFYIAFQIFVLLNNQCVSSHNNLKLAHMRKRLLPTCCVPSACIKLAGSLQLTSMVLHLFPSCLFLTHCSHTKVSASSWYLRSVACPHSSQFASVCGIVGMFSCGAAIASTESWTTSLSAIASLFGLCPFFQHLLHTPTSLASQLVHIVSGSICAI